MYHHKEINNQILSTGQVVDHYGKNKTNHILGVIGHEKPQELITKNVT